MNTIQRAYDPRLVREINPHHNHHTRSQPHATLQNPYLTKLRSSSSRSKWSVVTSYITSATGPLARVE